jgi:hypothetical protein
MFIHFPRLGGWTARIAAEGGIMCLPLASVSPPRFADSATLGFAILAATLESVALADNL